MTVSPAIHANISGIEPPLETNEPGALAIRRGVQRLMRQSGFESIAEMPLGNGRRADVLALGPDGEIHIIEIKSSLADFNADRKWPEYRDYCDRFSFAVAPAFPVDVLPVGVGLILADGYGGDIARASPVAALPPARRKALLLSFARTAAMRLQAQLDPSQSLEAL